MLACVRVTCENNIVFAKLSAELLHIQENVSVGQGKTNPNKYINYIRYSWIYIRVYIARSQSILEERGTKVGKRTTVNKLFVQIQLYLLVFSFSGLIYSLQYVINTAFAIITGLQLYQDIMNYVYDPCTLFSPFASMYATATLADTSGIALRRRCTSYCDIILTILLAVLYAFGVHYIDFAPSTMESMYITGQIMILYVFFLFLFYHDRSKNLNL